MSRKASPYNRFVGSFIRQLHPRSLADGKRAMREAAAAYKGHHSGKAPSKVNPTHAGGLMEELLPVAALGAGLYIFRGPIGIAIEKVNNLAKPGGSSSSTSSSSGSSSNGTNGLKRSSDGQCRSWSQIDSELRGASYPGPFDHGSQEASAYANAVHTATPNDQISYC